MCIRTELFPAPAGLVHRENSVSPIECWDFGSIQAAHVFHIASEAVSVTGLVTASPLCAVSSDFPSIHIGFPVPSCSQRKSDSKGHLSGLQKVQWVLQPDKPQQELLGPGLRAGSRGGGVDFTKRTRKFLRGHVLESQPAGGHRVARLGFSVEYGRHSVGSAPTLRAPLLLPSHGHSVQSVYTNLKLAILSL